MSDPYIQELFAKRIGGKEYGKSTAIYKFEKLHKNMVYVRKAFRRNELEHQNRRL